MTRNRWILAGAAALVVVIGVIVVVNRGGGSPDTNTPQGALLHQIDLLRKGQYGRAYDEIVPQQQALFTRDQYITCLTTTHPQVGSVKVTESYTERIAIPGTDLRADSTAITVELQSLFGPQTATFHEFNVDGQWRFTVTDPDETRNGSC